MNQRLVVLSFVVIAAVAAACKPPAPLPPRPVRDGNRDSLIADSIARWRADSIRHAELARQERAADSLKRARENEQRDAVDNTDEMAILRATIYFEYDRADLSEAAKDLLAAKIPILQARPTLSIMITGHTDSRGSSEYNIALGLRRAAMVKEWLVNNGLESSRIEIMSMGEERPAVLGEGEHAWSQNRRAEFVPLVGE